MALLYEPRHTREMNVNWQRFAADQEKVGGQIAANASTLTRDAYKTWQEDLVKILRDPLSIFDDLSASVGTAVPIHKKQFEYGTVDGEFTAKESMRFTRESFRDTVETQEYAIPIPIYSQEFGWDYRENAAIEIEGGGQIGAAHRDASFYSVKNALENMVLNGTESAINGQKALGLLNHSAVNTATYSGDNLNAADGDTWRNAIAALLTGLDADNFVGEAVTLYVNPNDWLMAGLTRYNTYDGQTCAAFVRAQDRINEVRTVRKLAANTIIALVKRKDVIQIPYSMPPNIRPIGRVDDRDEFAFSTEAVTSICIKRTAKNQCGIIRLSKA